jgi:biofilm PGA synthesis N-glycosyltransferase PgaC
MNVSVGVIAYNEENNITVMLERLLGQTIAPKEIIVVSSGSTDRTKEIVMGFAARDRRVVLVEQERRLGKVSAINEFLSRAASRILVLASADVVPERNAIEHLCLPFRDKNVGIVASHPIPRAGNKGFISEVVQLQWQLHHAISTRQPKFGEFIAFRNVLKRLHNTSVDEECIAKEMKSLGYGCSYAQDAIVYNKGPDNLRDFLKQRRRIFCGHLELQRNHGYVAASMNPLAVARALAGSVNLKNIHYVTGAVLLECAGRILGLLDYCYRREKHYVWDIAKSTKNGYHSTANLQ